MPIKDRGSKNPPYFCIVLYWTMLSKIDSETVQNPWLITSPNKSFRRLSAKTMSTTRLIYRLTRRKADFLSGFRYLPLLTDVINFSQIFPVLSVTFDIGHRSLDQNPKHFRCSTQNQRLAKLGEHRLSNFGAIRLSGISPCHVISNISSLV